MKKLLKIAIVLAVAGLITAGLVWKFYVNKPHDDVEKATAAYMVSASDLWKQYNGNLSMADSMYTGKVIEVKGKFDRADKTDSLVYAVFVMEADSMFGDKSVRCEMLQKYNEETLALSSGAEVTLKGYCNGYDQTDIKLNKCSVIK